MRSWAIILSLLTVAPFGLSTDESERCKELYNEWKKELNSFNSKCIIEESDMASHFNCDSHECIKTAVELNLQFEDNFVGMCKMEVDGFEIHQEDQDLMKKVSEEITKCNKCVVKYTEFQNIEKLIIEQSCNIGQSCNQKCIDVRTSLSGLYREMIEKYCHQYMPGGCGEGGGITEGEVYDILQSKSNSISVYNNINLLCSSECGESLTKWYDSLNKLAKQECVVSSESIDLKTMDLSVSVFKLAPSCSPECTEKTGNLLTETYIMEPECKKEGLVSAHIGELSMSISEKSCGTKEVKMNNASKGFLTLAILVCGVVSVYFIVRCIQKRRSNQKPNSTVWKQGLPKKQPEMRGQGDKERMLIHGHDEEDDDEI